MWANAKRDGRPAEYKWRPFPSKLPLTMEGSGPHLILTWFLGPT